MKLEIWKKWTIHTAPRMEKKVFKDENISQVIHISHIMFLHPFTTIPLLKHTRKHSYVVLFAWCDPFMSYHIFINVKFNKLYNK